MRIEKLHFANLNSLKGEWEIDFTEPRYQQEGIFAITGPTGAGKSTVLDAISLALYSRTPRLDRVNKSSNELMNKESKTCSSELVFSAKGKRYRASWTQRKSSRTKNGEANLQESKAKLEILKESNGVAHWESLAEKKKEVEDKIVEVTGLEFEQFTRSVLLAQGGFAAFLKAKDKERAHSLEQITGTEIYSEISKQVHARKNEEDKKLELLENELGGKRLLTSEERAEKEKELQTSSELSRILANNIEDLNKKIEWKNSISEQEAYKRKLEVRKQELEADKSAWEVKEAQVVQAKKANSLVPQKAALDGLDNSIAEMGKDIGNLQGEINQGDENEKTALGKQQELQGKAEDRSKELTALQKLLIDVRKLDTELIGKEAQLSESLKEVRSAEATLEKTRNEVGKTRKLHEQVREQLRIRETWVSENGQEKILPDKKEKIVSDKTQWVSLSDDLEDRKRRVLVARQAAETADQTLAGLIPRHETAKKSLLSSEEEEKSIEKKIQGILGGRELEDLSLLSSELSEQLSDLMQARALLDSYSKEIQNKKSILERLNQKREELKAKSESQQKSRELIASLKKQAEQLEKLTYIASLTEQRQSLRENEPCPLCGSSDHPYCIELPENTETSKKELDRVRAKQNEEERKEQQLLVQMATLKAAVDECIKQAGASDVQAEEYHSRAEGFLQQFNLQWEEDTGNLKVEVDKEITGAKAQKGQVDKRIKAYSSLVKDKNKAVDERNANEKKLSALSEEKAAAEAKQEQAKKLLESGENDAADADKKVEAFLVQLNLTWHAYCGGHPILRENVLSFLEELRRKGEAFDKQEELLEQARGREKEISTELAHLGQSQAANQDAVNIALAKYNNQSEEVKEKRRQRFELFGDKDCEQEEQRANDACELAKKNLEASVQALNALRAVVIKAKASLEEKLRQMKSFEESRAEAIGKWSRALSEAGFASEEQWQKARTPDDELKSQEKEIADFKSKLAETCSQLGLTDKTLKEKLDQNLTQEATETLTESRKAAQDEKAGADSRCGAISKELENDKKAREESAVLLSRIEKQKKVCNSWDSLYGLIGSADGSKYKTFVQGLAFESLVEKANKALKVLSSRYFLIRRKDSALQLDVIDNDMGGEVRPTDNLSGGESFIVSLALALGLSRMASNNIRIDSLFLDEGFGSLDEESLDRALYALSKLHEEGKLIGLISHVSKIKEDIGLQIEVTPLTGGVSKLEGPGVRYLGEGVKL